MTSVIVSKDRIQVLEAERYVSGTKNAYQIQVVFSEDWCNLDKLITFRTEAVEAPLKIDQGHCAAFYMPDSLFETPSSKLQIGAIGKSGNQTILRTIWTTLGRVQAGMELDCPDDPTTGVPDGNHPLPPGGVKDQVLAKASERDGDVYWADIKALANIDQSAVSSTAPLPLSTISLFQGQLSEIPEGWSLCDGQNGTPDLRFSFVIGASEDLPPGTTNRADMPILPDTPVPSSDPIDPGFNQDDPTIIFYALAYIMKTSHTKEESDWFSLIDAIPVIDDVIPETSGTYISENLKLIIEPTDEEPYEFNLGKEILHIDRSQEYRIIITRMDNSKLTAMLNAEGKIISIEEQSFAEQVKEVAGSGGESAPGKDGKSAYEIAVENGFTGSESEWLASLKGSDGKSAYQIAVDNGYKGTEQEWIDSVQNNNTPTTKTINGVITSSKDLDGPGLYHFGPDASLQLSDGTTVTDIANQDAIVSISDGQTIIATTTKGTYEIQTDSEGNLNSTTSTPLSVSARNVTFQDALANLNATNVQDAIVALNDKIGSGGGTGSGEGVSGKDGLSAYQIAVKNGFEGTEAEWLTSLKGSKGDAGKNGTDGKSAYQLAVDAGYTGTENEWLESLSGKSAYEIAKEAGYTGTEEDFAKSLASTPEAVESTTITSGSDLSILATGSAQKVENLVLTSPSSEAQIKIEDQYVYISPPIIKEDGTKVVEIYTQDGRKITTIINLDETIQSIVTESAFDSKSPSYSAGVGITIEESTISVTNPVTGMTQAEYDALPDGQSQGLVVVKDAKPSKLIYDGQEISLPHGKSAYDIAVGNGYEGTEQEWVASLKGVEGESAYDIAVANGYTGTLEEWLSSLKGDSAYDIAVKGGYTGTEEEFSKLLSVGISDIQTDLDGKVEAVEGKGLSTNDFTDEAKTSLDRVVKDLPVLQVSVESLQTDKIDKVNGMGLSENNFTNEYKDKLTSLHNTDWTEAPLATTDIKGMVKIGQNLSMDEAGYLSAIDPDWDAIQNKPTVALKSDLVNIYRYKGAVATSIDLPTEGQSVGDVYDVKETGMNYGWDGKKWDPLGQIFKMEGIWVKPMSYVDYNALDDAEKAKDVLYIVTNDPSAQTGALPVGSIVAYSNATNAIPSGWALCDGANDTPDLRDRFILGASDTHAAGTTGGSSELAINVGDISGLSSITDGGSMFVANEDQIASDPTVTSDPLTVMPPYYALSYIIKVEEAASTTTALYYKGRKIV